MAERIQLRDPGAEIVLCVTSVKPETVEKNDYYLFSSPTTELLVPQSSVMGQITRLGVTQVSELVGKTIKLSRSTKMSRAGKPYWNVDLASGAEAGTSASASGAVPATVAAVAPGVFPDKPTQRAAYKALTQWVLDEILPMYGNPDDAPPEIIASITATLFIQACKSGKVQ